ERLLPGLADLLLAKEAELQGVVLAAGTDVVDEDIVLGDLVPLLGMVPEPAGIGDQLTVPVDQGVVNRDNPLRAVAGAGVLLEEVQAASIQGLDVPGGVGQEPIEAGLVGGLGEFVMDPQDGLAVGDHQSGEVLREMAAPGLAGKEVAKQLQGVTNDRREFDD